MKLSVLLLCWNHVRFLAQCIGALAKQSDRDFEIIFLDNLSSDGSFEQAATLFERFGLTIKMLRNYEPTSIPANLNRLLGASTGDVVAVLSTDDWYEADYVAAIKGAASQSPAGWFSCGGWIYFDDLGLSRPVENEQFSGSVTEAILAGRTPHFFVGCAYRRSALDAVGAWDEGQLIEDRDMFLRLSLRFEHHNINRRLVHYRKSSTAASANQIFMVQGWDRFYTKHGALFGAKLRLRRAKTYQGAAAVLTDQGQRAAAARMLAKAVGLNPLSAQSWRTVAYLGWLIIRS